jgi:hypothetical protein
MQLCHPPVAQVLAAAHGVGKVNTPAIPVIHIPHCRGDATLGHDSVCFAQEGLRNESDLYPSCRGLDSSAQTCPPSANDQNVVFVGDVFGH